MLPQLGFHGTWINWIKGCLQSYWALVLVNWRPTQEFKCSKGFHQGDSLAPFSFLVVVEGLIELMRQARHKNLFEGYVVDKNECEINLL